MFSFFYNRRQSITKLFYSCLIFFALLLLLAFPKCCILGAQNGLLLWYSQVLPVLLPFFIISSFISAYIHTSPVFTTITLGVLCGYPMGAKNIKDYYLQGYFSKKTAQTLLCICNHASPMFLIGYVCTTKLEGLIPVSVFLPAIYWPPFLYGLIKLLSNKKSRPKASLIKLCFQANPYTASSQPLPKLTLDNSIEHSLLLICKIGCYIMIYSILCNLLFTCAASFENLSKLPITIPALTGFLEMTTGIASVADTACNPILKASLITAISSFGGCSSISQIKSALKGTPLSVMPYAIVKFCFGILSGISIYCYLSCQ